MKGFVRSNPYLSLCGLNCKLCSMNISGHCGGCGFGNQSCPIARCSLDQGSPEDLPIKDRAKLMEERLKEKSSVELKLRRK